MSKPVHNIVVVGAEKTGKTSIIHKFSTITENGTAIFHELGLDFLSIVCNFSFENISGAFIVISDVDEDTLKNAVQWKNILDLKVPKSFPIILLVNKINWDTRIPSHGKDHHNWLDRKKEFYDSFCKLHNFTDWFPTSVLHNFGLETALYNMEESFKKTTNTNLPSSSESNDINTPTPEPTTEGIPKPTERELICKFANGIIKIHNDANGYYERFITDLENYYFEFFYGDLQEGFKYYEKLKELVVEVRKLLVSEKCFVSRVLKIMNYIMSFGESYLISTSESTTEKVPKTGERELVCKFAHSIKSMCGKGGSDKTYTTKNLEQYYFQLYYGDLEDLQDGFGHYKKFREFVTEIRKLVMVNELRDTKVLSIMNYLMAFGESYLLS